MVLGIYGSGGLGREILDLARETGRIAEAWEKIIFINDNKNEPVINGAEVFTFDEFKNLFPSGCAKIAIAVGEPKVRQLLREKATSDGYRLQTIIHPSAFVGSETRFGDGVIVQYGCFISCNVKIGDNVLFQASSNIGHDSVVGPDTVISSFVVISGACNIGDRTYIGINVPVREKISIGTDSIVGMGAVVLSDIPDNVVAFGNPARTIKNNESGRVFK